MTPARKSFSTSLHTGVLFLLIFLFSEASALAKPGTPANFGLADESPDAGPSAGIIAPHAAVQPFYQWNANAGYCGEVSMIQSGMGQGQWISQYNARLICGTGLSQSGPDGFCAANGKTPDYNSQLLLESPLSTDTVFASAGLCLANYRLQAQGYPKALQPDGMAGYRDFMSWIKSQVIHGSTVTIGVLNKGGSDPQYDHEVTVTQIGTNHALTDATYYGDDVLYFDDHGDHIASYAFDDLAQTRDGANALFAANYSILIPGGAPVSSQTGGDGINVNAIPVVAGNYGFAVSGPLDTQGVTVPVALKITGAADPSGSAYPAHPVSGFDFELPEIGPSGSCTNVPPTSWMNLSLEATVSGLRTGSAYNLYEYDFPEITGTGTSAALAVPTDHFNANAGQAAHVTHFTATSSTYVKALTASSRTTVVLRCVPASAP